MKKVLIAGATGLVGAKLIETISLKNDAHISILTRDKSKNPFQGSYPLNVFEWDPDNHFIDPRAMEGVDIVINLAGSSIAEGNWNEENKKKILKSRINSTALLVEHINKANSSVKKLINASAIGFYGDTGEDMITEKTPKGSGFLSDVCDEWEKESLKVTNKNCKVNIVRIGLVLSPNGGLLEKILPLFNLGLGGEISHGKQYMSWIHLTDLVEILIYLMNNLKTENIIYNATSPRPVSNYIFTKILSKEISRPAFFKVPKTILKIALGDKSVLALEGQKVIPKNLLSEGYPFKYRTLKDALRDCIIEYKEKKNILLKRLWINEKVDHVFDFFSNEKNLETITPEYLKFKIVSMSTTEIEKDSIITYKLKIHGIPVKWISKISVFEKNKVFVDEQLKGPYKKWHHTHEFFELNGGTLMVDTVRFKIPLGIVGDIIMGRFIRKDIRNIFKYRNQTITKLITTKKEVL